MNESPQHSAPVQVRKFFYFCANCKDQWSQSEPRGHDVCSHCEMDAVREIICHLELAAMGNPISAFDYRAFFDGEEEANQCGFGCTKAEAIADLLANWGDG